MANTKPKIFKSFFIYDNDENRELLEIIEEIRRRDGWTFSKLAHEALKEWAKNHYVNPQMSLVRFSGESKLVVKCQHANCDNPSCFEVWARNKWHGYLCETHFFRNKDARLLKRWKKL